MNKFVEMSTFVSVVESQSFVGAAAKLGTSKSVVSQRVKMLEKRLGASLLERGPRLSLTEAGLLFYQECVRILDEVTQAEEAVAPSRSELHGELRIATSHTFMTTHLSTILAGFIGAHPGLSLDISTEDRQINMHQPDFDIAIRLGLVPDSTLIARTLARNLTWLCARARLCTPLSWSSMTDCYIPTVRQAVAGSYCITGSARTGASEIVCVRIMLSACWKPPKQGLGLWSCRYF